MPLWSALTGTHHHARTWRFPTSLNDSHFFHALYHCDLAATRMLLSVSVSYWPELEGKQELENLSYFLVFWILFCFVLILLLFLFLFWDKLLRCDPGQPGTHCLFSTTTPALASNLLQSFCSPGILSAGIMGICHGVQFFFFSEFLTWYISLSCFYILYGNHSPVNAWHFLSLQHIEYRLKVSLPCDLGAALTDGVVLCHLANHVRPRSVPSIHVPSPAVVSCSARQPWLFIGCFSVQWSHRTGS